MKGYSLKHRQLQPLSSTDGDHAFGVISPSACHHLPMELKLIQSSTTTFKRHLMPFFFNSEYGMCYWAIHRRDTTNAAVTVTDNRTCEMNWDG